MHLRDCFLKAFQDTDDTVHTEFHGKSLKKPLFSVLSVKSVYPGCSIPHIEMHPGCTPHVSFSDGNRTCGVYKKCIGEDLRNTFGGDQKRLQLPGMTFFPNLCEQH